MPSPKTADVKDIERDVSKCRAAIRQLKAETVQTVSFTPTGKLQIVDREKLVALNEEADRLQALMESNITILDKLMVALGTFPSIQALREDISTTDRRINDSHQYYRRVLAQTLTRFQDRGQPLDLEKDPEAVALRDERDEKLAIYEPRLEAEEKALAEAQKIREGFKPSDLPDGLLDESNYGAVISRADVGGMA